MEKVGVGIHSPLELVKVEPNLGDEEPQYSEPKQQEGTSSENSDDLDQKNQNKESRWGKDDDKDLFRTYRVL